MHRKIIGMLTGYTSANQSDWLWQQTPNFFGVWNNIQMLATADKPDFLLLYNFAGIRKEFTKKHWLAKPELHNVPYASR